MLPRLTRIVQSSKHAASSHCSAVQSRRLHIEPGAREKALLEEDPALKKFRSHKNAIRRMHVARDILTIVVISGCCYEIMYKTFEKKAEREKRKESGEYA